MNNRLKKHYNNRKDNSSPYPTWTSLPTLLLLIPTTIELH